MVFYAWYEQNVYSIIIQRKVPITWPASSHGDDDHQEEEDDEDESHGQITSPVVDPQLAGVHLEEALFLLTARQLDLLLQADVLVQAGQRTVHHHCLLQTEDVIHDEDKKTGRGAQRRSYVLVK